MTLFTAVAAAALARTAAAQAPALTAKDIYEKDGPSVVLILASHADGKGELGTGSIVDANGTVLTNAHVVIDAKTGAPFEKIRVYLKPAKVTGDEQKDLELMIPAKVGKYDRDIDLATLTLAKKPGRPALALGEDASVETGDPVVAIGHPEQGGFWTLTQGVISTMVADLGGVKGKNAFQTDASINRGNSGGPLIARDGTIVGVNTSMARKADDGLAITSVNFSLRASVARKFLGEDAAPAAAPIAAAPAVAATPAAPAPATPAPVATAPAPSPAAPAAPAKVAAAPKKPAILTPAKPYRIDDLLERQMKEMEDLGNEMHDEIQRRMGN